MNRKVKNYIGMRSGMLTVIGQFKSANLRDKHVKVVCKCDCGKTTVTRASLIANNRSLSCGCRALETNKKRLTKHNCYGTRIYRIWCGIKKRCFDAKDHGYYRYGGRGITMCEEWKNSFETFYKWAMANGYKETLTIDRVNNNGNYEPSNCRWATVKEQGRNRNMNKVILYQGVRKCAAEWAEQLGLNYNTLLTHLRNGMSVENALEYKGGYK